MFKVKKAEREVTSADINAMAEAFWKGIADLKERQDRFAKQVEEDWKKEKEKWAKDDEKRAKDEEQRAKDEEAIKRLNKQLGSLHNTIGDLVEFLMTPNLTKKFRELGYHFTTYARDKVYKDLNDNALAEVDVLVENGDYVLVVEVKTKPCIADLEEHAHRMDVIRRYADERNDKRKYIGAIATPGFSKPHIREATIAAGFFIIEASENAVNITTPKDFKPKEW